MNRIPIRRIILASAGLAAAVAVVFLVRGGPQSSPAEAAQSGYASSDPALLAATGRPQLVEFFSHT